jgi:hypothetical protein
MEGPGRLEDLVRGSWPFLERGGWMGGGMSRLRLSINRVELIFSIEFIFILFVLGLMA